MQKQDGNKKSFKMLPELVPSGCMPMPWGFFSDDGSGLTLTVFMAGSHLFLMHLYGWQSIEHWVLLYFQVCSISAYPQHSGERYRTSGPLVCIFNTDIFCLVHVHLEEDFSGILISRHDKHGLSSMIIIQYLTDIYWGFETWYWTMLMETVCRIDFRSFHFWFTLVVGSCCIKLPLSWQQINEFVRIQI